MIWQVGEDYILKVYEDKSMLERNIKIMSVLAGMKVAVEDGFLEFFDRYLIELKDE